MENDNFEIKNLILNFKIEKYFKILQMFFIFFIFAFCIPWAVHAGVISDAPTLKHVGLNVLNFLLSVVGIIAIITLVLSGMLYFFSAGDERKMEVAKKTAMSAIVGIVLILGSMVLIRQIGVFFN